MKEEKTWYGLKKKVPEKEWEAKYLVGLEQQNVILSLGIWGFVTILVLGLILFASTAISVPCEIEIEGTYSGEIDANLEELGIDGLKVLSIDYLKGKTKVQMPCVALTKALADR